MPDQKISQLTGGGAAQATDEIPIARSGSNFKLTGANIAAAATSVGTLSSLTVSGAASIQTLAASGQSLTGTQATSLVDLAATWNTTGTPTAIKLNVTDTASNANSLLMDLQVGGVRRASIAKTGELALARVSNEFSRIANTGGGGLLLGAGFVAIASNGTYPVANINAGAPGQSVQTDLGFTPIAGVSGFSWRNVVLNGSLVWDQLASAVSDLVVTRDAANTLAQRNGTNAQTFRLYNTFTDVSNYERGKLEWASNVLRIGTEKAGTGTARALELQTDGTTRVTIAATTGNVTATGFVQAAIRGYDAASLKIGSREDGISYWTAQQCISLLLNGTPGLTWSGSAHFIGANDAYAICSAANPASGGADVYLRRDAAGTFAQRDGTNAQTFNIYNTFTSTTNYERLSIAATAAGAVRIRTNKGSGGGTARALELGTDDTTRVTIPTTGGCVVGTAALATNATDGFLYVPTCAGTPTGTPTAQTGTVPIVVDTTNNKLYFYSSAAWRDAGP